MMNYQKYVFECICKDESLFLLWGNMLASGDEFLLMDNYKLLLFKSIDDLLYYVGNKQSEEELINWADHFDGTIESTKLSLNLVHTIRTITILTPEHLTLWKEISLLIELYDDLKYLSLKEFGVEHEAVEGFKDMFNNNFVWKNVEKKAFVIDEAFRRSMVKITEFIQRNIQVIS